MQNKYQNYVQGHGLLSLAKKIGNKYGKRIVNKGITAAKIFNNSKYGKALEKEGLKFAKTSANPSLEKYAQAIDDLIGNKIADKISSLNNEPEQPEEQEQQEIIIPLEKRQQIIDDLRLF